MPAPKFLILSLSKWLIHLQSCPVRNEPDQKLGLQREMSPRAGVSPSWRHDCETRHLAQQDSHEPARFRPWHRGARLRAGILGRSLRPQLGRATALSLRAPEPGRARHATRLSAEVCQLLADAAHATNHAVPEHRAAARRMLRDDLNGAATGHSQKPMNPETMRKLPPERGRGDTSQPQHMPGVGGARLGRELPPSRRASVRGKLCQGRWGHHRLQEQERNDGKQVDRHPENLVEWWAFKAMQVIRSRCAIPSKPKSVISRAEARYMEAVPFCHAGTRALAEIGASHV